MEAQIITDEKERNAGQDQREEIEKEIANCNTEEVQDKLSDSNKPSEGKKRGRPSKTQDSPRTIIEEPVEPPRRESQRIKKVRQTLDYTPAKVKCVWSNQEKLLLLKGLDRHGDKNIKGLMEYLPTRAESEVKSQIKMWKEFGNEDVEKKVLLEDKKNCNSTQVMLTKLHKWMEYFMSETEMSCSSQFALSNTFLLIAEYGKFPPPDECQGIDFRGLYRALHCLLNGSPYYGLNQATAKMLENSFSTLTKRLGKSISRRHFEPHLINGIPRKRTTRHYGRPSYRGKLLERSNGEAVLQMPGINPLNLHLPAIKQHSVLFDEEEEDSSEDNFSDDDD